MPTVALVVPVESLWKKADLHLDGKSAKMAQQGAGALVGYKA